jgi:uncharacterized protein YbbK (DUF523 family)
MGYLPAERIASWPPFNPASPLRVIGRGCVAGRACGADGTSYGEYPLARLLLGLPCVSAVSFCAEDAAFGTPRAEPDIQGGDGFDVLDGLARVASDRGDETDGMILAAAQMADLAVRHGAHLALLMDVSAACGSSVIYDGPRRLRIYRRGPGVAAAALLRAGVSVVSQRDERTLALLFAKLNVEAAHLPFTDGLDHRERDWYLRHLGAGRDPR